MVSKNQKNSSWGGGWTKVKLEILERYLKAYTLAMKNTAFKVSYIDAFAGTGFLESTAQNEASRTLFAEEDEDRTKFISGSADIALRVENEFQEYIFVEKDSLKCRELSKLKGSYPDANIKIINEDANSAIKNICMNKNWRECRAVMFLDPFGMEIKWETIEVIAKTKAVDLWVLFPLGVGVNRLLQKNGITDWAKEKLNAFFGTSDWEKEFYTRDSELESQQALFNGEEEQNIKIATLDSIGQFFIKRLKGIFARVAENPAKLCNSKNNPLFLFCFAVSNPNEKAVSIAMRIAGHILDNIEGN